MLNERKYNSYYEVMRDGKEIVIISKDELADSAIFYMTRAGVICSFNRSFGLMDRPDMSKERFERHIRKMLDEGSSVIVRGSY